MTEKIKQIITNLPEKPGVYRYFDSSDQLLYIGKAKNLKKRVSSYFQTSRPHNQRIALMVSRIHKIEYTVVSSEKDSLILEANLIHSLQPKFNVLLKDDKSFVYVRIPLDWEIPNVFLTRKKYDPKSLYFGPYTQRNQILHILNTIRAIFPYCSHKTKTGRPCPYYSIKKCDGICIGLESKDEYLQKMSQIGLLLSGKTGLANSYLEEKMHEAAANSNFALAALWRDRQADLSQVVGSQKVVLSKPLDLDLITLVYTKNESGLDLGSLFVQQIRDGRIINVNNFLLSGSESQDGEEENQQIYMQMLGQFLKSYRLSSSNLEIPIICRVYEKQGT